MEQDHLETVMEHIFSPDKVFYHHQRLSALQERLVPLSPKNCADNDYQEIIVFT